MTPDKANVDPVQ